MNRTSVDHVYRTIRRELRFAVSYPDFTRALETLLGRINPVLLSEIASDSPERARERLGSLVGPSGFALFQKIDHGSMLKVLAGRNVPSMTYVVGNMLLGSEMTKHEPLVGLYLPSRVQVCESETNGVVVSYDVPSVTLAQFGSAPVDAAATSHDARLEKLLDVAAVLAAKARVQKVRTHFRVAEGGRR